MHRFSRLQDVSEKINNEIRKVFGRFWILKFLLDIGPPSSLLEWREVFGALAQGAIATSSSLDLQ